MRIVWDEPKRETNLAKHGLDFAAFADGFDFDGAVVVAPAQVLSAAPGLSCWASSKVG
jgi:uncharacterized DUF497 family protein